MFSPVHSVWLLVSLCVCGISNFERFFLRRYYRFAICFTLRFVHFTCVFGAIHVRCVSEMWFRVLLDL